MLTYLFLKGWMIGFSIAMPVGPIGMLCIRHSLIRGTMYGLVAGLGAALADTLYGLMAGLGMTVVCEFLTRHQFSCQFIGALFLCYLGMKTLSSPPPETPNKDVVSLSFRRVFFTTFFLTLTNPLTMLSFIGIYAALGIGGAEEKLYSTLMIASGIFIGSAAWWLVLSSSSSLIARKMNFKSTRLLNRISGTVLLLFGLLAGFAAFQRIQLLSFS